MRLCKALMRAAGIAVLPMLAHAAAAKQLCEREVVPFAAMLAALKAEPGVTVDRETPATVELADAKRMILWTLSKPAQSPASAFICRRVVQEGDRIVIKLSAECHGTNADCDGLIDRVLTAQKQATEHLRQR